MTIAPRTSVSERPHRVTLQNPGAPTPNPADPGTFLQSWTDLSPPAMFASIAPATATDLERVAAGTVIASASHIVKLPYHPQVTTQTRVLFNGRQFSVKGVANPEERNVELILACEEVIL